MTVAGDAAGEQRPQNGRLWRGAVPEPRAHVSTSERMLNIFDKKQLSGVGSNNDILPNGANRTEGEST
jgi:hypothetical protein